MIFISKDNYEFRFLHFKSEFKKCIDIRQYSDKYVAIDGHSYCGLHYQKNNITQINGLFSLHKGYGAKLIEELKKDCKYLRLNCDGVVLEEYYRKLGFKTYLSLGNYKEMMWKRDN